MHRVYRLYKILHIKKELKEVYANQLIETLALSIIGIFIPAFLIETGFGFIDVVFFVILQYASFLLTTPLSARIDSRIGIKHTILVRAPILIAYFAAVMVLGSFPGLFIPAALMGGISISLYWTSMTTEYIMSSDEKREGEEAGMFYGVPYLATIAGPVTGAIILTVFGFSYLFAISALLILASVVPLFLSADYKGDGFRMKGISLLLDKRKALYYFVYGNIHNTDLIFWGLYVFFSYGFISLGIAASLMGLGVLIFILIVGSRTNTIRGRRRAIRIGGFLSVVLWIMRFLADSEIEFMLLSVAGGFILMSFSVPLYADFAHYAKRNGPARTAVFRYIWTILGFLIPLSLIGLFLTGLGAPQMIQAMFLVCAVFSLVLITFKE